MSSKKKTGFLTSAKNRIKRLSPLSSRSQSPSLDPSPSRAPAPGAKHGGPDIMPVVPPLGSPGTKAPTPIPTFCLPAGPSTGESGGDTDGAPDVTLVVPPLVSHDAAEAPAAPAPIPPSSLGSSEPKIMLANNLQDTAKSTQDGLTPSKMEKAMDYLGVAGSFATMFMRRVPDFVDSNPVAMAFGLANAIIEISGTVKGNRSAVEQQVIWTSAQLLIVQKSLVEWRARNSSEDEALKSFEEKLERQRQRLVELTNQCLLRRLATHEDLQDEIAGIFAQVDQAREELLLETGLTVHRIVHDIEETLKKSLLRDLKPSDMANFKYHAEGQERQALRRDACTPGTRVRILDAIKTWSRDTSTTSESVYWLFGSAGSGKSTIAYTIAGQTTTATSSTTLGGNFFCSRQFESTRHSKRIVPTIAYHLAQQCPSFADALASCNFDVVQQSPRTQLKELLVKPWLQSATTRASDPYSPLSYLIIIDALDEIEGDGGTDFLRGLLDIIDTEQLPSLKFFITSRPNPSIVNHVASFTNKKLYRLEEIPVNEANADIERYLNDALPHFKGSDLLRQLVRLAAGLFIFAATVVKHITKRHPGVKNQQNALKKLISGSVRPDATTPPSATQPLDQLYIQVLTDAFADLHEDLFAGQLRIIHTFLCTAERTSTAVVTGLLPDDDEENSDDAELEDNPAFVPTEVADLVVQRLYSVLYVENGRVLAYHKSFSDFIFDKTRSGRFSCDQPTHHRLLATSCLHLMTSRLRFNIASIPSSYVFNQDNLVLQDHIHLEKCIPSDLRYACQYWAHHLKQTGPYHSTNAPLLTSLSEFMHLSALFWIEAMSILGWVGSCDPILRTAYDFVPSDNLALQQALNEAASFSLYFSSSPASLSTPHLYISALSTTLQTAYPISEWKSHFPTIPRFTSSQARSSALMTIDVGAIPLCLAISDNGKLIASGTKSNDVRIWDGLTGRLLHTLEGHARQVQSVSFFSDNARVVSASDDTTIKIWDVQTATEVRVLRGHLSPVNSANISPDGDQIVSGSDDMSVRIWDVDTGNLVKVLEGHAGRIRSVVFSDAPARWILSGADDCTIRIWDMKTDQVLTNGVLRGHSTPVHSVYFSPSNHRIVSGSYRNTIMVWDPTTRGQLAMLEDDTTRGMSTLSFATNGSKVVLGTQDGEVHILDSNTWKVIGLMKAHEVSVRAVIFSADGKRIISTSRDKSIRVWNALSTAWTSELQGLTRKGHSRAAANDCILQVTMSHDGTKILSVSDDHTISLWDATTGNLLRRFENHTSKVVSVAFSTDDRAILSVSWDKSLRRWDSSTGEVLHVMQVEFKVWDACTSSDGARMIASSPRDNVVRVWDISTGQVVQELEGHTQGVNAVAFSLNGKYAGTGSKDNTARIWDVSSEQPARCVWVLEGHSGRVLSIAFSADCSRIASASNDYSCRIWDMATGNCLLVLDGHTTPPTSITFSPDGAILATGSNDATLRLWDTNSGETREVLRGHTLHINDVTFSPDGKKVISCSGDGTIRVWCFTKAKLYRVQEKPLELSSRVQPTGWLVGNDNSDLLMHIPVEDFVSHSFNTLVIPPSASSSVSFLHTSLGPNWSMCYSKP